MRLGGKGRTTPMGSPTGFAACHRRGSALARRAVLVAAALALSAPAAAAEASLVDSLGPGGWCWFADPRAVHFSGANDRTYVGWVSVSGRLVVAAYDRQTQTRTVLGNVPFLDDHDNPTLLVLPGGRLMVFYSHHDAGPLRYRVSQRPEDISAWGPEGVVPTNVGGPPHKGWTYPNPLLLSGEGNRVYLFWRAANWNPAFSTLRAGGRWARARQLIRVPGRRPYVKFATNGRDSIYFAFTRSHPGEGRTGIYFARYRRGSFFGARGGRRIGTLRRLPLRPAQADTVYRPRPGQSSGWVHDVAVSRRHRPVIVYAAFRSAGDHVYRYARWNGRRWENHTITRAGGSISTAPGRRGRREIYYSPGISLDHSDPSVVYLSLRRGRAREIERWRTSNGGRSWRRWAITAGSPVDNIRPVVPRNLGPGKSEVVWMRGSYIRYTNFQTSIRAWLARSAPPRPTADFHAVASAKRTLRFERTAGERS